MIKLSYVGPPHSPSAEKRMEKLIAKMMSEDGRNGHSASGWSAIKAIEWCEANGKDWTLHHAVGGGYMVEMMK